MINTINYEPMIGVVPATTAIDVPMGRPGSTVGLLMRRPGSVTKTRRSASTTKVLIVGAPLVATTPGSASWLLLMLVQMSRVTRISSILATLLLCPDVQADKRLK
jgi:hypothetical protein